MIIRGISRSQRDVWKDVSSPRNPSQKSHEIQQKLYQMIIFMYSKRGPRSCSLGKGDELLCAPIFSQWD